ncbi:MAG: hypothetical protein OSB57_09225 [Planctomycetota bacterium]|nr:hypothetical protein [Planctomycetota bacterium]
METTTSESGRTGVTVLPGGSVSGPMYPPGSKSLAQRYLLAAFLAEGPTRLAGVPECLDVEAMLGALRSLAGSGWGQDGNFVGGAWPLQGSPKTSLSLGESGTCARLLTACVALGGQGRGSVHFRPEGTLVSRTSPALGESLVAAGANLGTRFKAEAPPVLGWPLTVEPVDCPPCLTIRDPSSSQEVSGLLFALAARGGGTVAVEGVIPSEPYVRMTESVLEEFGVQVDEVDGLFTVTGALMAPAHTITIEPDASAAAVLLAAGCISGGTVRIPGLTSDSVQGDLRVIEYLQAFGCRGAVDAEGAMAGGVPSRGAKIDLSGEPDLAPVMAVVGAIACLRSGEPSVLEGLGTLEGKESPRLSGLAEVLRRLGWQVRTGPDWLSVDAAPTDFHGGAPPVPIDSKGDHRIAFTLSLLGVAHVGVRIVGADCVGKSYPNFWADLAGAGANIEL